MGYLNLRERLQSGGIAILDGGTGTELERRGVPMDPEAWCGPATLENSEILEEIHRDYIAAGADVITANTFASSRLMLKGTGLEDRFDDINRVAVETAMQARASSGRDDVLVAGSLSHMIPVEAGTARPDLSRAASETEMEEAFGELADLLKREGCDLIVLEMMYHPDRMGAAFRAALATGLPVWAGFSLRRGEAGEILSFAPDRDIPFAELASILDDFDVDAADVMHTPSNIIAEAVAILRERFSGPLTAYPDSGYFKMPRWQFEDVIPPNELREFAEAWIENGVQVIGGCCGLSPEHIAAVASLKTHRAA